MTSGRFTILARLTFSRLAAVVLVGSFVGAASSADRVPTKRVLLVYHTEGSIPAFLNFEQSLVETLHSTMGSKLEFYREQLDSGRFPEYKNQRIAEFRSRYSNRRINAVIFFGCVRPGRV